MGDYSKTQQVRGCTPFFRKDNQGKGGSTDKGKESELIIPLMYHVLMVSYGWTIDYISNNVTIPQLFYLRDTIIKNPPISIMSFGFGEKLKSLDKLDEQLMKFGSKVEYKKFIKKSIKSVIRLKDGKKLK